jgi:hypothetical protein
MQSLNELWSDIVAFVGNRQYAYATVFGNRVKRSGEQKVVLADLAKFCRANASTWDDDAAKRDVLIGRREVWLRIQEHLNLTPTEMAELYALIPKPKDN